MEEIQIWVPGEPAAAGSKKGFFNKKLGRVMIVDANKKASPWKACVSAAASQVVSAIIEGPLRVRFDFVAVRPKSHYGSGKNANVLKLSAPAFPAVKPDAGKLARGTEDALTGIVWRDDAQIVTEILTKRYGNQAGAWIRIKEEVPA